MWSIVTSWSTECGHLLESCSQMWLYKIKLWERGFVPLIMMYIKGRCSSTTAYYVLYTHIDTSRRKILCNWQDDPTRDVTGTCIGESYMNTSTALEVLSNTQPHGVQEYCVQNTKIFFCLPLRHPLTDPSTNKKKRENVVNTFRGKVSVVWKLTVLFSQIQTKTFSSVKIDAHLRQSHILQ